MLIYQFRTIVTLAFLACSVAPASATEPTASPERPNILIIYTDDQGYGDVSCLNPEAKFETPNFDRLAREGITFTDGHCSDTVCTPSRYGLLTGRYSWRTELKRGVLGAEHPCLISDDRMTLASLLREQGYRTAMVGKWHLGMDFPGEIADRDWSQPVRDMPLDKGFDHFWGIPASMNYGVLAWFEGRHPLTPPTLYTRKKPNAIAISDYRIKPPYDAKPQYQTVNGERRLKRNELEVAADFVDADCLTRFTDQTIAWLEKNAAPDSQAEPFFLYLPYTSPHKPVIPIERFRGKSEAGAYGDFMMETDWHVGRIMDTLQRLDVDRQTMVILTSDNGPENTWRERIERHGHRSNGSYREGKRSIYEGGHRVPFFIRWPEKIEAGRVCDTPICQTDLLATIAGLLQVPLPPQAGEDSVDLSGLLIGDAETADEQANNLAQSRPPMVHHAMNGRFAVRHGRWKLVMESRQPQRSRELYDLETDPQESHNRLAEHPEVAERLAEQLRTIVRDGRTTDGPPQPNDTEWWSDLSWMKAW